VYGFLNLRHVFFLIHVVLNIGLASSHFPWLCAFSSEVSRAVAVIAFADSLWARVALECFPYLGNVSSEALLVGCPVWGEASPRQVHRDWDVVHGSWGV